MTIMNIASVYSNPGACFAQVVGTRVLSGQVKGKFVALWSDGQAERVGFNTILPPNGPSCVDDGNTNADSTGGAMPPSSYHPGGVNSVFADGSIHFINQNINTGNLAAPQPLPGQGSPYGVWGAWARSTAARAWATSVLDPTRVGRCPILFLKKSKTGC